MTTCTIAHVGPLVVQMQTTLQAGSIEALNAFFADKQACMLDILASSTVAELNASIAGLSADNPWATLSNVGALAQMLGSAPGRHELRVPPAVEAAYTPGAMLAAMGDAAEYYGWTPKQAALLKSFGDQPLELMGSGAVAAPCTCAVAARAGSSQAVSIVGMVMLGLLIVALLVKMLRN